MAYTYMKQLLILAPVYLEVNADLVVGSPQRQEEQVMLDSNYCEFQIESPLKIERHQPVTSAFNASKFDPLDSLPPDHDRNYLNFPFLTDSKTLAYLTHHDTNVMFVMRGLSGSGKSSIVNIIRSSFKQVIVCSADDYFYQANGSYKFVQELLTSAHGACQQKAKQACKNRVPIVIIDNTNVKRWEFKFYIDLAKTNGYIVVLVQPKTPWRWNPEELAARNKHGLETEVLKRKIAMFDNVIPTYYGWFLNEKRSKCLNRLCSCILLECLSIFPKLKRDFLRELNVKFENTDDETAQGILSGYYSSESSRSPLLHCTAKFCAWGKAPDARDYHERPDVQHSCGQMFIVAITGLVITKKTLGARVSLGPSASVLFARPEEEEWDSQNSKSLQGRITGIHLMEDTDEENQDVRRSKKNGKRNEITFVKKNKKGQKNVHDKKEKVYKNYTGKKNGRFNDEDLLVSQFERTTDRCQDSNVTDSLLVPDIDKKSETIVSLSDMFPFLNFCNQARSAHFTIKTARGVESKDVNYDVLRACDLEASRVYTMTDFVPVSRGRACYYGDGLCCVYFDRPLSVRTLFSGYY